MPVSSVSDFEHFAEKIKENIRVKIKQTKTESVEYLHVKDEEANQKREIWLKDAQEDWKQFCNEKEKQEEIKIAQEINGLWSEFKQKHNLLLKERLSKRLEEIFPALAECFIANISAKYETGIFTMSKSYTHLVNKEHFELNISEKEEVTFKKGNLYIEYSVERIILELEDEIWQR